jgi:hypothetical protein
MQVERKLETKHYSHLKVIYLFVGRGTEQSHLLL